MGLQRHQQQPSGDQRVRAFVLQLNSTDDLQKNWEQISSLLDLIPQQEQTAFVSLPENALYLRLKDQEPIPGISLKHAVWELFKSVANSKNLLFHVGSVPLQLEGSQKMTNSTVMVTPNGEISSPYQKVHLFDIQLEGDKALRESDVFQHGKTPAIFQFGDWKMGLSVCYDLRFSELFSNYAQQGVDLITVPSAFLVPTGQAHWEVLLRARAIESQCYVLAAAQAGTHRSSKGHTQTRQTYGHSLIVDPWGKILAQGAAQGTQVLQVELHKQEILKVRKQIPMAAHRRI